MDSASEKGALLQGLCPGISCVFNKRVQLFDWMIVKWVLSLWIIWLLPALWQQVLRLRLQDNNVIFLPHQPAPFLSDLTKIWDKISEPESRKNHKRDLTRLIQPSEWAGHYGDVQVKNAKPLLTVVSPDQLGFAFSMSFKLLPPAFP